MCVCVCVVGVGGLTGTVFLYGFPPFQIFARVKQPCRRLSSSKMSHTTKEVEKGMTEPIKSHLRCETKSSYRTASMDTLNRLKEAASQNKAVEDRASECSPHPSSMSLHTK